MGDPPDSNGIEREPTEGAPKKTVESFETHAAPVVGNYDLSNSELFPPNNIPFKNSHAPFVIDSATIPEDPGAKTHGRLPENICSVGEEWPLSKVDVDPTNTTA